MLRAALLDIIEAELLRQRAADADYDISLR
jgi:hypothetical protein